MKQSAAAEPVTGKTRRACHLAPVGAAQGPAFPPGRRISANEALGAGTAGPFFLCPAEPHGGPSPSHRGSPPLAGAAEPRSAHPAMDAPGDVAPECEAVRPRGRETAGW